MESHETVVAHQKIAEIDPLPAERHARIDPASLGRKRITRRYAASEDRKVGTAPDRADVADGAVANPAPQVTSQDFADRRRFGVVAGRNDQNLALADPIDGQENCPEVRRLAQGSNGASEQTRLPAWRKQRSDRLIDLPHGESYVDGDGDGAPSFNLGDS
jgi:hypothetical protein